MKLKLRQVDAFADKVLAETRGHSSFGGLARHIPDGQLTAGK